MEAVNPIVTSTLPEDTLYKATRAWIIWLQGLFRNRPKGHYRWCPNVDETEILISDQEPIHLESTNKRPLISTTRSAATWMGTSIDQMRLHALGGTGKTYTDLISLSVNISIVAKEGIEAQNIAYTIFRMIPVFRPQICRLGSIHMIGTNLTVTPETEHGRLYPGSSTPEWKLVQVVVPIFIQDSITVVNEDFYSLINTVSLYMGLT